MRASSDAMEPHCNDYKTRNILSLEERVQVIREYERNPKYQRLADKFKCSAKQIKNIVANRESILRYFATCLSDGSINEAQQRRQQKIAFLGRVVYEFVQRALYHGVPLDAERVRQKALEVKECIAVENFYPNAAWLHHFKATYGLPAFDADSLRNNVVIDELKSDALRAIDLVQYVSRQEQQEKKKQQQQQEQQRQQRQQQRQQIASKRGVRDAEDGGVEGGGGRYQVRVADDAATVASGEPVVAYELEVDDDAGGESCMDIVKSESDSPADHVFYIEAAQGPASEDCDAERAASSSVRSLTPLPDIESLEEALRHLRVLEDFAMLQENYRAIGLLTQLEQVFQQHRPHSD